MTGNAYVTARGRRDPDPITHVSAGKHRGKTRRTRIEAVCGAPLAMILTEPETDKPIKFDPRSKRACKRCAELVDSYGYGGRDES